MSATTENLIPVLESALNQVLEAMYFFTSSYCGPATLEGPLLGASLAFSISSGIGEFRLIVTERLAVSMTAEFLPAAPEDVTWAQAEATVRELTNVACGVVFSAWMPTEELQLAIPRKLESAAFRQPFDDCFAVTGGLVSPELAIQIDLHAAV